MCNIRKYHQMNASAPIYVEGMAQITPQQPFSDGWYDAPVRYGKGLHPAIDPPYAGIIPASAARRMSLLQKRAVATALKALSSACLRTPDAIITATGAGTMRNSESFLRGMVSGRGEGLSPTPFINSTHNTLAATVAIALGCKGYNTTYSHNAMSFPTALTDAMIGLETGKFGSVLLSAHDEMPVRYYDLLEAAGVFAEEPFAGEHSLSFVLRSGRSGRSLAAITDVRTVSSASVRAFKAAVSAAVDAKPDLVFSGDAAESRAVLGEIAPMYGYKEVFGGGFSSPAASLYAAVTFLSKRKDLNTILLHDHYRHGQHSFISVARLHD